jgi:uncharacterized protein YhbP (UPF0306 family)
MPSGQNLNALYREYLGKFTTMAIATVNNGSGLDCSTVYYAYDEAGNIYFVSDRDTNKAKAIAENNKFAAAMNDGGTSAMGVKIKGRATRLDDPAEAMAARSALLTRIPAIEPFLANPGIQFFRLIPEKRFLINFAWGVDWRVEVT